MHRFGDQIELRVDRRHLLLFFLGAVFWTLVAFFVGMLVSGDGKTRTAEKGLAALGWLDKNAQKKLAAMRSQQGVGFAFARRPAPRRVAAPVHVPPEPTRSAAMNEPAAAPAAPSPAAPSPAAPSPAPRPAVLAPPARRPSGWTYRIAMRVKRRRVARRLHKRFEGQGHKSKLDILSPQMHRITYGRFPTRAAADLVVVRLREQGHLGQIRVIRVR